MCYILDAPEKHAGVAEWQTHLTQNQAYLRTCRFKSGLRHHEKTHASLARLACVFSNEARFAAYEVFLRDIKRASLLMLSKAKHFMPSESSVLHVFESVTICQSILPHEKRAGVKFQFCSSYFLRENMLKDRKRISLVEI